MTMPRSYGAYSCTLQINQQHPWNYVASTIPDANTCIIENCWLLLKTLLKVITHGGGGGGVFIYTCIKLGILSLCTEP